MEPDVSYLEPLFAISEPAYGEMWVDAAKDLFKVETLDARFASKTAGPLPDARPSKWSTAEFYVYYAAFLTVPVFMFKAVYDVSRPAHPGYATYEHLLSPGWIPGRKVDNSDAQYRGFRDNIPAMLVVLAVHPILRSFFEWLASGRKSSDANLDGDDGRVGIGQASVHRKERRLRFDVAFAAVFLIILHGVSAFKVLLLLYLNYQVATALPKQHVPVTTWVFNLCALFANELCHGYPFADLFTLILPSVTAPAQGQAVGLAKWGAWLDSYGGLVPRWEILFNITVLRMIAFNFDYLWMHDRGTANSLEKKNLDPTALSERDRVAIGAERTDFTFRNYLAYTLYSPLYLAGPIITFNDYIAQSTYRLPSTARLRIVPYAIRFAICLLTMELVLHFLYPVAIAKAKPDWNIYNPFQLSMLGYFHLHIIWLKLLLPWRFFRLWALSDGIDPPENMVRCMSDNYSALAFWRGWHRSYNRWVVRYIYGPLGGSRNQPAWKSARNYAAVFTFVALWHDVNLRLLIWGWLAVIFVAPEVLARMAFPPSRWKEHPNAYRYLSGIGAVGNILMLMVANLIGFAVGLDGIKGLIDGIVGSAGGRWFVLGACAALFIGVQVMFEWRESEHRRGVDMKC